MRDSHCKMYWQMQRYSNCFLKGIKTSEEISKTYGFVQTPIHFYVEITSITSSLYVYVGGLLKLLLKSVTLWDMISLFVSITDDHKLCQTHVNAAALYLYSSVDVLFSLQQWCVCSSSWPLYCACLLTCKLLSPPPSPHTHTHTLPQGSVLWVMRRSRAYVQRPVT